MLKHQIGKTQVKADYLVGSYWNILERANPDLLEKILKIIERCKKNESLLNTDNKQ